jgi:NADPH-dependent ferric siderophore reductase
MMRRLILAGKELERFTSLSPDDHVKLFVPGEGGDEEPRDYTPRRYDAETDELAIDFALHDAGAATSWAKDAVPGASVDVGGPRGSVVVPPDFDWWQLVGDETASPAIGRRLEELPSRTKLMSVVAVANPDEEQAFDTATDLHAGWGTSFGKSGPRSRTHSRRAPLPHQASVDGFAWIAQKQASPEPSTSVRKRSAATPPQRCAPGGTGRRASQTVTRTSRADPSPRRTIAAPRTGRTRAMHRDGMVPLDAEDIEGDKSWWHSLTAQDRSLRRSRPGSVTGRSR